MSSIPKINEPWWPLDPDLDKCEQEQLNHFSYELWKQYWKGEYPNLSFEVVFRTEVYKDD